MLKNQKGFALTTVMIFLVIFVTITAIAFNISMQNIKTTNRTINNEDALYYAEAGFNRYLFFLNEDHQFYKSDQSDDIVNSESISFKDGFYSLEVSPPEENSPYVTVESTGWVANNKNQSRTIRVRVRKRQFTNFAYGTNSERSEAGTEIWWATGDVVNGPLHTNGQLRIQGDPVFKGPVTYAGAAPEISPSWSNPDYQAGEPAEVSALVFPQNNGELKTLAESPDGYYYEGRTAILIDGDELRIRNKAGNVVVRDIPANGVIYVDGGDFGKFDMNSGNVFISGELDGRLTIASKNDIYITGYDPTEWDTDPLNFEDESDYEHYTGGIRYSDSSIDSNNDNMLGLIAQNDISILHYGWPRASGSWSDYEWDFVWRQNWLGNWYRDWYRDYRDVALEDIDIYGAIFTLDGSFGFEDYNSGSPKDYINLTGSLMQNYRGPVGLVGGSSGYLKNYVHDYRMAYDTPPHFLEPENSGWEIIGWKEIY
jgi:Tfp pilus assembly protein PilE